MVLESSRNSEMLDMSGVDDVKCVKVRNCDVSTINARPCNIL